jgi:hypothetical protein
MFIKPKEITFERVPQTEFFFDFFL